MKITYDESYLYLYDDMKRLSFTDRAVNKLCFQANTTSNRVGETAIKQIKDYLENHYKMYQYIKDNGVKYGEHELFYWDNGNDLYFTVNLNDERFSVEYNNRIVDEIIDYITKNYSNIKGYVSIQLEERTNWDKVNDYVHTTDFDINNLPYSTLQMITSKAYCKGNTLDIESRNKLSAIESELMNAFVDHRVFYEQVSDGIFGKSKNVIKGTLRKINNSTFGVFKPHAKKQYYRIGLTMIADLKLA